MKNRSNVLVCEQAAARSGGARPAPKLHCEGSSAGHGGPRSCLCATW